jgi:hypothetical protein
MFDAVPPRRGRPGTARAALALLAAPFLLGGCFLFHGATPAPVRQANLNRDTPRATYEYFRTMVANNQWAAEWSVFSPHFKRLLNQSVGRNVDVGDYTLARQTVADNSNADMQLLLSSTWVGQQMLSPNAAVVTIESGGRRLSPRLVKLSRWELQVVGDDTPYGDFLTSVGDAVRVGPDGSVTVSIRPPQATASLLRTFRPDQIEAFHVESQWYLDDFGGLDRQIVQQAGSPGQPAAPAAPRATPAPVRPVQPPAPPLPPTPPPVTRPPTPQPRTPPYGPPPDAGQAQPGTNGGTARGWGSPDG